MIETPQPVEPIARGRFAFYRMPDGGLHISYLKDGEEETQHLDVPGFILKLAEQAANGKMNPVKMLAIMRGHNADTST